MLNVLHHEGLKFTNNLKDKGKNQRKLMSKTTWQNWQNFKQY